MKRFRSVIKGFFLCVLAVAWSWLAGAIFFTIIHLPVDLTTPFTIWRYAFRYLGVNPVQQWIAFSGFLACLTFGLLFGLWIKLRRRQAPYGDAHWASSADVERAGLWSETGLILGKRSGRTLCVPGWEHLMCFAPSGSGKGVGIVIPNLLHWSDSAIVHDVKGENFRLTSGYRAERGQKVYFFNPGDPEGRTHRYNPFQFVSDDPGLRIDDLQKIAHLLLPKHDFWENEARTLLVGLALYLLDEPDKTVSFGTLLCTMRQSNFYDFVYNLLATRCTEINPVAAMALNAFVQKAAKERSGVLSTLSAALELWANPLIDAATSASDFDLRRFKKERMTLYIGVSPNNLHRLRPLLQILYQQATDILTEKEPDLATEPYGVLFLMDEFTSLGKMTQFEQASAYFRGYRVRFMMIIQDLPQLERHYDRTGLNSFMGMTKVKLTFASGDYQTAETISQYLGSRGVPVVSTSRSGPWGGPESRSVHDISRRLLMPQEILQLPPDQEILMIEGMPPVLAEKIRYFDEPTFQSRLRPPVIIHPIDPIIRDIKQMSLPPRDLSDSEFDANVPAQLPAEQATEAVA